METIGCVQNCGCIALAPDVQKQTGLYPGATFRVEIMPDKRVILIPIETKAFSEFPDGTTCG